MISVDPNTFEPGLFSNEELSWLLDHIEEPSVVALHNLPEKDHVYIHPARIAPFLDRLQSLAQLKKANRQEWCGYSPIKDSILRYIEWQKVTAEILRVTGGPRSTNAIHHPSQYAWDSSGRAFRFGIDADSAELVRTEILEDGTRRPFAVRLLSESGEKPGLDTVAPWVKRAKQNAAESPDDLVEQKVKGRKGSLTCSICGEAIAYDTAARNQFSMARARMGRHLKTAKDDIARHRLLYRKLYESSSSKV